MFGALMLCLLRVIFLFLEEKRGKAHMHFDQSSTLIRCITVPS